MAVHDLLIAHVQVEGLDPSYTGTTAVAIVPLPLPPGAEARALLHHLLDSGDIIGRDSAGRAVIQLAADDWLLEQLMIFDAGAEHLEETNDAEPDVDVEPDSPAVLCFDRVPVRQLYRGSAIFRQNVTIPDRRASRSGLDLS